MTKYIKLIRQGGEVITELPLEDDDTLLFSDVLNEFPGATGIKAIVSETSKRAVKLRDGKFYPLNASPDLQNKFVVSVAPKRVRDDSDDGPQPSNKMAAPARSELIVLGLPFELRADGLRSYFAKFGQVVDVDVKTFPNGSSKGYGFVKFKDERVASKVAADNHMIAGRVCTAKFPYPRGGASGQNINGQPVEGMHYDSGPAPAKLFVGRLTTQVTVQALTKHFAQYGGLKDVYIPQKPFRGIAYVQYADVESVTKALAAQKHVVSDVELNVSQATPRVFDPNLANRHHSGPQYQGQPQGGQSNRGEYQGGYNWNSGGGDPRGFNSGYNAGFQHQAPQSYGNYDNGNQAGGQTGSYGRTAGLMGDSPYDRNASGNPQGAGLYAAADHAAQNAQSYAQGQQVYGTYPQQQQQPVGTYQQGVRPNQGQHSQHVGANLGGYGMSGYGP